VTFLLCCFIGALPVLAAWRIGNRVIDTTDYGFRVPPLRVSPVATAEHALETARLTGGGGELVETSAAETRGARVARPRRAA
jgi:hypothetical protein